MGLFYVCARQSKLLSGIKSHAGPVSCIINVPQPGVIRPGDDLDAVGVILWEMVSGIAEMVAGKERLRLDGEKLTFLSRKELPMAAILGRAVAEQPEQRYMNAGAMLSGLELLVAELMRKSAA